MACGSDTNIFEASDRGPASSVVARGAVQASDEPVRGADTDPAKPSRTRQGVSVTPEPKARSTSPRPSSWMGPIHLPGGCWHQPQMTSDNYAEVLTGTGCRAARGARRTRGGLDRLLFSGERSSAPSSTR